MSLASAAVVHLVAPSAAGSGIPQMKCVLAGVNSAGARLPDDARQVGVDGARLRRRALDRQGGAVRPHPAASRWLIRLPPSAHRPVRPPAQPARCRLRRRRRLHLRRAGRRRALLDRGDVHVLLGEPPVEGDVHAVCGALVFRVAERTTGSKAFSITDFGGMSELLYNGEIFAFGFLGAFCAARRRLRPPTASLVRLVRTLRNALPRSSTRPPSPPPPPPPTTTAAAQCGCARGGDAARRRRAALAVRVHARRRVHVGDARVSVRLLPVVAARGDQRARVGAVRPRRGGRTRRSCST